jgi:glucokinase
VNIYSLDIGGSSIKQAIVRVEKSRGEIVSRFPSIELSTRLFSEVRERVISAVALQTTVAKSPIAVAISTTGAVDRSGLVLGAGHFEGYVDVAWSQVLQAEFPGRVSEVITVNDGKASTWAEYQRVGLGTEMFVHFVVGTGVGGGIVSFGRLLYGDDETAGALGHMKVGGASEVVCSCGRHGCVETLASGPAIARSFGESLGRTGVDQDRRPTFEQAFLAARDGNPGALRAFELAGEWLGVAMSNVINVLNPRHITVGGGVLLASADLDDDGGPYLRSAIRRAHELAFEDIAEATLITPASAGNDGGLLGAALLCGTAVRPPT